MTQTHEPDTLIDGGLRALMSEIIDYAGLFPPASLHLSEAIENYARYRSDPEAWMLARFIIPAGRLQELEAHSALFEDDPPFRFSVLAGGAADEERFIESLESDLKRAAAFQYAHGDRVAVEVIELRMPDARLATDVVTVGGFLGEIDAALERHGLENADLFLELSLDDNIRQTAPILTGALSTRNRSESSGDRGLAALKLRTGGTTPGAVPPVERVAAVVAACRDAGVRFKATAGLHHPVRHYDERLGTKMHGFFNVFVAAVFAAADGAVEKEIADVLLEENPEAFGFLENALQWKDRRVGVQSVAQSRRELAISFGSCSFREPIDDLRGLGLI